MNFCFLATEIKLLAFTSCCKCSQIGRHRRFEGFFFRYRSRFPPSVPTTSGALKRQFLRINT